jgi:hypothetical protein
VLPAAPSGLVGTSATLGTGRGGSSRPAPRTMAAMEELRAKIVLFK